MRMREQERWPATPAHDFRDTCATLQMWMQIAGKICLALTPRTNHFWNIAFLVTPRGIATPSMPYGRRRVHDLFDLVAQQCLVQCSDGRTAPIGLEPQTVADFHRADDGRRCTTSASKANLDHAGRSGGSDRFEEDARIASYDPARRRTLLAHAG